MKNFDLEILPELIRAVTPICLIVMGGGIAIAVLISSGMKESTSLAALNLVSNAIAGAAGMAISSKSSGKSLSVTKEENEVKIETMRSSPP